MGRTYMVLELITTMMSSFAYLIRQAWFILGIDWQSERNFPAGRSALPSNSSFFRKTHKCMLVAEILLVTEILHNQTCGGSK